MSRPVPPDGYYDGRRRSVIWPVLLIAAGVVFLLQNFGLLNWQMWGSVWQFWPVVLLSLIHI